MSGESTARKIANAPAASPTKGERTRARLKDAARTVLGERGYHDLRITDVCREAGVSQGTFYLYFENKHAITLEVIVEFIADSQRAMLASGPRDDAFETIAAATQVYVDVLSENVALARAMLQMADTDPEVAEIWHRTNHDWLARVVRDLDERFGPGRVDARTRWLTVYAMNWMVDGFLHNLLLRDDPYMQREIGAVEDIAAALSVLWYRAVYGTNPPQPVPGAAKFTAMRVPDRGAAS